MSVHVYGPGKHVPAAGINVFLANQIMSQGQDPLTADAYVGGSTSLAITTVPLPITRS